MFASYQRVIWSGFALSPALTLLLLPDQVVNVALKQFGPSVILALAWVVAFGAAHFSRHAIDSRAERAAPLLSLSALRHPPAEMPDPQDIRQSLRHILQSPPPVTSPYGAAEPETLDYALSRAVERILGSWGKRKLAELTREELQELWMLEQLVRATPDRAGALAQSFVNPDVVLEIRDRIAAIGQHRHAYEAQIGAFEATRRAWSDAAGGPPDRLLLTALQALDRPDPDLWHKVIVEHDPADPAQADAALWCARQPSCERASVAHFLAYAAADGRIEAAARRGDCLWLQGLQDVIEGWNARRYAGRSLGLTPPDAVATSAPALTAALDRLAEITCTPRLADPRGIFAEYRGRAARPRDHWCLATGRLQAPPQIADYVEPADIHAA
ncbi:hypothetical protein M4578_23745 [Salipiger sp. P9]|uniref:hypothetical protein n=1 Tax=Salipiger pentaromativorans TaxID=2943193 RepID=UPI0021581B6C|nr:hypothetical protein [Salipiger pentaromativorans]MCR8550850.1 hypothetical protein [Salipiger pentaromativorans]